MIVMTKGENGSLILSEEGISIHDGIETSVVDTVGAGDSFTASIVMGLLYGYTVDEMTIVQTALRCVQDRGDNSTT